MAEKSKSRKKVLIRRTVVVLTNLPQQEQPLERAYLSRGRAKPYGSRADI